MYDRKERRRRFAVIVVAAGLAAVPAAPAEARTSPSISVDLQAVDAFVQREMDAASIPGAALVITHGDAVVHIRGFGEDSSHRRVTGDTLFRIASLSKSFTALAVMQLVEAGQIGLEDPVGSYLDDFRPVDPRARRITVRQLLDQTSGLADNRVAPMSRPQPSTLQEAVGSVLDARLVAEPGTHWNYHNPNYQVAARLVEVVSGESFRDYLRDHIFLPAGMGRTSSADFYDEPVDGLAEGHVIAYGHAVSMPPPHIFTAGDGGVVTNAEDLAQWLIVQANGGLSSDGTRVLSRRGIAQMHTASAPGGYALGWDTSGPPSSPTTVLHSGTVLTFSAYQAVLPASGYGVALTFNASTPMLAAETAMLEGVLDIVEGRTQNPSGPRYSPRTADFLLAVPTLGALLLGMGGVIRARAWSARHVRTHMRTLIHLTPQLAVLILVAKFPAILGSLVGGRELTWTTVSYAWPALVLLVLSMLVASLATITARVWQLARQFRSAP